MENFRLRISVYNIRLCLVQFSGSMQFFSAITFSFSIVLVMCSYSTEMASKLL